MPARFFTTELSVGLGTVRYLYPKASDRIISSGFHCRNRAKVIYNGVDTRFFCPGKDDDTPIFDGNLKVGCAARLMPIKALHVLVEAAADPDFQNAGVHFYIAGDGPLRQELLEYAQSVGALDFFHLLGFTNDTRDFYRALDIFVMPSFKRRFFKCFDRGHGMWPAYCHNCCRGQS